MGVLSSRSMASTKALDSGAPRQLAPLFQDAKRARRTRHQEAIAAGDQALDVTRIRMRMAARDMVFLTDIQNAVDSVRYHGVFVFSGMAQLLAQVALAD
jgi:hypothetical protein